LGQSRRTWELKKQEIHGTSRNGTEEEKFAKRQGRGGFANVCAPDSPQNLLHKSKKEHAKKKVAVWRARERKEHSHMPGCREDGGRRGKTCLIPS